VDLPTLGAPTMATNPDLKSANSSFISGTLYPSLYYG
jgi:hypothetical protein